METHQARSTAVAVAVAALVLAAAAALALTVSGGSSTVLAADPAASAADAAQSEINVTTDGSGVEQATTAATTAGTTEGAAGSTEATPADECAPVDNPAVATPECVVEVVCVVDFDCIVDHTCLVDPIDNPQLINPGQLPPVGGGDTIAEIATHDVIDSGVLLEPIGGGAFDIDSIAP